MSKRINIIAGSLVIAALLIAPVGVFAMDALQVTGNLTGMVFYDADQSGTLDLGEVGIGGVTVELTDPSAAVTSTTTASDGTYGFTITEAGDYTVVETDPVGYASTTPNQVAVTFEGTPIEDVNFGDVPDAEAATASITGTVYNDLNRDRELTLPDESGLAGAIVSLFDDAGEQIGVSLTTAAEGTYSFAALPPGIYTVTEEDPPDFYSTTPNEVQVSVTLAAEVVTVNFGDFQPEEGEVSEKESQIWDYFGVPLLDVLELRDTYGWGFGNIARALFLSQMTSTPLADIITAREDDGMGWGNILKQFNDGVASLKGNNLGLIMSGRGEPNVNAAQASKAGACAMSVEDYAGYVAQFGQGNVNKACKLYVQATNGIDFGAILSAVSTGMKMKELKAMIHTSAPSSLESPTTEETDDSHGPPACKGYKKNDPGC